MYYGVLHMISQQQAAPAILRLSVLPFFNALMTEAREELVNTLAAVADDQGHAGRIISEWLLEQSELPTPAQLREMAKQSRLANPGANADDSCRCGGGGFAGAWYLATLQGQKRPVKYEFLAEISPNGTTPPEVQEMNDILKRKGITDFEQQVTIATRRCTACAYGQRLALAKQMAEHEQPEPKRRR